MMDYESFSVRKEPSIAYIFELKSPLDCQLSIQQQSLFIYENATLSELHSSSKLIASLGELRGLTLRQLIQRVRDKGFEWNERGILDRLEQFISHHFQLEDVPTDMVIRGQKMELLASYYGFLENSLLKRLLITHRNSFARQQREFLISTISESLVAESGRSFFNRLTSVLAQNLECDYVLAAEYVPECSSSLKLLSSYESKTEKYDSIDDVNDFLQLLDLKKLMSSSVIYESDAKNVYPVDDFFNHHAVKDFIVIPFRGSNNHLLGVIALLHSETMQNVDLAESVLNVFSIRAAAEVERYRNVLLKQRYEKQQRIFFEHNGSGMFIVDVDPPMPIDLPVRKQVQWLIDCTRFVDVNEAMPVFFNMASKNELLGKGLYLEDIGYDFATYAREYIDGDYQCEDLLWRFSIPDSDELWLSATLSSALVNNEVTQIFGIMTNVTSRVLHSQRMEYQARHDSLTGLVNRNYFIEQIEQVINLSCQGSQHALFILDLDGFKEVNDTLGHDTGDLLLQNIGPRIDDVFSGENAIVARLGGDEFAVFIENYSSQSAVSDFAKNLMEAIKSPFEIRELELIVGGSVGISLYPFNSTTVSSLMRCADVAMYKAKNDSRDFCIYDSDQDHYSVRRLSLMMDIRQAIHNDEMRIYYQPIMNLNTLDVVSFEALIRWQHPEHGMLSPGEFIPLIEITDMIMPVTYWVVENSIKQLREWKKLGWRYRVSVNVSTRNLVDVGFVDFIVACLSRYEVEGNLLEIEITESTLMADPEKSRQVLKAIASQGISISVDDYGTGYSSLAYLKSLPINTLKIDQTFVSEMLRNTQDQIIVSSTIQLAHNLGLSVTAEGIEEAEIIDQLTALGCDKGQGYYFCRPVEVAKLESWLTNKERILLSG